MPPAPADFRRLLTALAEHEVDFIVVGGVAAVVQGAPVTTVDLDIVPELSDTNVAALEKALESVGATYRGRPELRPDRRALASRGHKLLATRVGPLDVLGAIGDDEGYAELIEDVIELEVWSIQIKVLNLDELIRIKKRVGRDKDRAILPILERTLEERARPPVSTPIAIEVVDCSQIRSPEELWSTFPALASVEGLMAESSPRVLEVRNVDPLIDAGYGAVIAELEHAAGLLAGANAAIELSIIRFARSPRGVLYQHEAFRTRELEGLAIESLLVADSEVLLIKPTDRHWQQICVDAGLCFWTELDEADALSPWEGSTNDLGAERGLIGEILGPVEARCERADWSVRVAIAERGSLVLRPTVPGDLEAVARLDVEL